MVKDHHVNGVRNEQLWSKKLGDLSMMLSSRAVSLDDIGQRGLMQYISYGDIQRARSGTPDKIETCSGHYRGLSDVRKKV